MTIIVTDDGFRHEETDRQVLTPDDLRSADDAPEGIALALSNDADPAEAARWFGRVAAIHVPFPSFADGRGFSIARELRRLGYTGTLRATGHVIADQYAHARRVGFDEVAISDELAARQPEDQWLARAGWRDHFYQKRLLGERNPV